MSKDYLHKFRRKIDIGGCSQGDSETVELRDNFNEMVDEKLSPTVHTVKYIKRENVGVDTEGIEINVNITDVSTNDQKTNDEKYVNFKWDLDVQSGDQFYWQDSWWTLYHQEKLSILSHKMFTCKKCNYAYNLKAEGKEYHFPVLLTNLTLYSDGMSDKVYMSNQDGSRRITISDNEYSKFFKVGTRIMLSSTTIYEVAHMDDFSRPGVKDAILTQVFITSKDDTENLVAWNSFSDVPIDEEAETFLTGIILGEDVIRLGGNEIYKHTLKGCIPLWEVISEDDCVWIDTSYNNSVDGGIKLQCTSDFAYIGTKITLRATNDAGEVVTKEIIIGGF